MSIFDFNQAVNPLVEELTDLLTSIDGVPASIPFSIQRVINISNDGTTEYDPTVPVAPPITTTPTRPDPSQNLPELVKQKAAIDIDGQIWEVKALIDNLSVAQATDIPITSIHELTIEHDVLDPCFIRGSMIVTANRFGGVTISGDAPAGENPDTDTPENEIVIRGDGRDYLSITLAPVFDGASEFPPEVWRFHNEFVIYDSEDIPWKDQTVQAKKLYFWHVGYQSLIETDSVFSTGDYPLDHVDTSVPVEFKTDQQRTMTVSTAIKRLLQTAGLQRYIDESEWDVGSDASRIFYTSNGTESILDTIQNILPYFVSSEGDPGILYFNRGKDLGGGFPGAFQLISIKKLFQEVGLSGAARSFYFETFIVGTADSGETDSEVTGEYKSIFPTDGGGVENDIFIKKYNLIQDNSFVLTDPASTDSTESLVSQVIHTYDMRDKAFKYCFVNSDILNFRDRFRRDYTQIFHPQAQGRPLLTLNRIKKENSRLNHRFVTSPDKTYEVIQQVGNSHLLRSALFLNLGISFKIQGSTHRHPGRFIGLEKLKTSNNRYDYRLLGVWFVTNTTIKWQEGSLYNTIAAVKVSSHRDLELEEDV